MLTAPNALAWVAILLCSPFQWCKRKWKVEEKIKAGLARGAKYRAFVIRLASLSRATASSAEHQAVIPRLFACPKMAAPGDLRQWHQMAAQNAKKTFL